MHELHYLDIIKILPHRKPFLLVDYAFVDRENMQCIGYKNVQESDFYFQGHFPDNPVMPGVIIIEALAQTSGLLGLNKKQNIYLVSVSNSRFTGLVKPNCLLALYAKQIRSKLNYYSFECEAKIDAQTYATAIISAIVK